MRIKVSGKARAAALVAALAMALTLVPALSGASASGGGAATWTKIADRGIDNPQVMMMFPFKEFAGRLYFLVSPGGGGGPSDPPQPAAPVWTYDGTSLAKAAPDGFGDPTNTSLNPGVVFQGRFYCGTGNSATGGQLWRTSDGNHWERVGAGRFDNPDNGDCFPLGVQGGRLLFGITGWMYGARVWAYDGTTFTRANSDGFGVGATSMSYGATFEGRVHVTANDDQHGVFVPMAYAGGTTWNQTGAAGFGDPDNRALYVLSADDGGLYGGTMNFKGGQLWRYNGSAWSKVDVGPAASPQGNALFGLRFAGRLYVSTARFGEYGGPEGTAKLFRQKGDGSFELWTEGFGDPYNSLIIPYLFRGKFVAGAGNMNGGQVWTYPAWPYVKSIDPASGPYGTRVTLAGGGFGTPPPAAGGAAVAPSYVSFDGAKVYQSEVLAWSDSRIVVRVPEGAKAGPVTVTNRRGVSDPVHFEPTLSKTYNFAEGSTRDNPTDGTYDEWLCVYNPDDRPVNVDVTYMMSGAQAMSVVKNYDVAPESRLTVDVESDVGTGKDVSIKVSAKRAIVAERTMYFNYRGMWTGGHDVMGIPEPGERWYFAEGTTRDNPVDGTFQEWLCLQNPGAKDAEVGITYMFTDGSTSDASVTVPAMGRVTRDVNLDVGKDRDVSILVSSAVPIVCERPVYYEYRGAWQGGDCAAGVRYPASELYLAEGCTYGWANEWITIMNPNPQAASVDIDYLLAGGARVAQSVTVPATGRHTVDVAAAVGADKDVSVVMESSLPIVAERPMYFDYQDKWPGGHIVAASQRPRERTYFAEGTTRQNSADGYYDEWLCMLNPNDESAVATVTFSRSDGDQAVAKIALDGKARTTVLVNDILGPDWDASVLVESDRPIVVERPTYFNYRGSAVGGHDSSGYGL